MESLPPGGRTAGRVRQLLARPAASLTARIATLVFCSTALTSLVVTTISVGSIRDFLSSQIEQKFPRTVERSSARVESWYGQAIQDVGTFASSATLEAELSSLRNARSRTGRDATRRAIENYLSTVLTRFDQYDALFLLDPQGEESFWAGERRRLPAPFRASLSGVAASRVSDVAWLGDERLQVVSAPIGAEARSLGTLHALLDLDQLDATLHAGEALPLGEVFLVGGDGRVLTSGRSRGAGGRYELPPGDGRSRQRIRHYTSADGEARVVATGHVPRFGWTLVVEAPYAAAFQPVLSFVRRVSLLNLSFALLFVSIAMRIAVSITRPVRALSEGAERVARGEGEVTIPEPAGPEEIAALTRSFNEMSRRVQQKSRELERLAITDELTGLYNHRHFQRELPVEMKRARRAKQSLALLLIDVDDFKRLNDEYGHAAGDEVLRGVAETMFSQVRETDMLARYGGEEFALLTIQESIEGAIGAAEKIRTAVEGTTLAVDPSGETVALSVTVSIGVALFESEEKAAFAAADDALYRAKAAGKNCVIAAGS